MNAHEKLNYVEFPAKDIPATKQFFETVFNWQFTDYGEDYTDFSNEGINGGFFASELASTTKDGAALLVFYSKALEETYQKIVNASGVITKEIFDFPGGRRFHFTEPSGNEFAVWSEPLA